MPTWTLKNRRTWAVIEFLQETASVRGMAEGVSPSEHNRAQAVAASSVIALGLVIESATYNKSRELWKALSPLPGGDAAIYLAHGLLAVYARQSEPPQAERLSAAREHLRVFFPWSDDDEAGIQHAVAQSDHPHESGTYIAIDALGRIYRDPMEFAAVADAMNDYSVEQMTAGLHWGVCINVANQTLIEGMGL